MLISLKKVPETEIRAHGFRMCLISLSGEGLATALKLATDVRCDEINCSSLLRLPEWLLRYDPNVVRLPLLKKIDTQTYLAKFYKGGC